MSVLEPPAPRSVTIGRQGRIVIPSQLRTELGLAEGDELVLRVEAGELRVATVSSALDRARRLVREKIDPTRSLVEELLEERRRESAE